MRIRLFFVAPLVALVACGGTSNDDEHLVPDADFGDGAADTTLAGDDSRISIATARATSS